MTFDIDYPDEVESIKVPSLFLLPVIENAIKYGVEPNTHESHISVLIDKEEDKICIQVIDSGGRFDSTTIKPGNGLRILHDTLRLHFANDYSAKLTSEEFWCMYDDQNTNSRS